MISSIWLLTIYCALVLVASLAGGWVLLIIRPTHTRLQIGDQSRGRPHARHRAAAFPAGRQRAVAFARPDGGVDARRVSAMFFLNGFFIFITTTRRRAIPKIATRPRCAGQTTIRPCAPCPHTGRQIRAATLLGRHGAWADLALSSRWPGIGCLGRSRGAQQYQAGGPGRGAGGDSPQAIRRDGHFNLDDCGRQFAIVAARFERAVCTGESGPARFCFISVRVILPVPMRPF